MKIVNKHKRIDELIDLIAACWERVFKLEKIDGALSNEYMNNYLALIEKYQTRIGDLNEVQK